MRDLLVAHLAQIRAEHFDVTIRRTIHRRDEVQQSGFAGTGRTHQRNKISTMNFNIDRVERYDVKFVANVLLAQASGLDDGLVRFRLFAHYCFTSTFSPSFKFAGGLTIRSSTPMSPLAIKTPRSELPSVTTARLRACPSKTTKTLPFCTAD